MTNGKEERDWRQLCELAAKETDSEKLYALVAQLNRALETRAQGMQGPPYDGSRDPNTAEDKQKERSS
jgi:hypothetical protein